MVKYKVLREYHPLDTPFKSQKEGELKNFFHYLSKESKWNPNGYCYYTIVIQYIENNTPKFLAEIKYRSNDFKHSTQGRDEVTYQFIKDKGIIPALNGRFNWHEAEKHNFKIH